MRASALRLAATAALTVAGLTGCSLFSRATPNDIAGHWEGTLGYRSGQVQVVLTVERDSLAGTWRATVGSPDLMLMDEPLPDFAFDAPRVAFTLPDLEAPLAFTGWCRSGRISGTLTSPALPAESRTESAPKLVLARRPAPPRAAVRDTVQFDGAGVRLAGTVLTPEGAGRHPGIVFLHGSALSTRSALMAYADTLARAGFVALTYDKRAHGASGGTPDYRVGDLVADAAAAVRWLRAHPRCDGRVAVFGRSQGAWLAPEVAARESLAFVIAVSAPGVPLRAVIAWQDSLRGLPPRGLPPEPWARAALDTDVLAPWRTLRAPALLLHGDRDDLVPAERSAAAIAAAAPHARLAWFAGADHLLRQRPEPGGDFDWPRVAPGVVDTLVAWSRRQTP
jgi:hypothetical protein